MMRNDNRGLIQFLVVIIVAVLVLTLSGFSIRDNVSKDAIISHAKSAKNTVSQTYDNHLSEQINTFVIEPSGVVWEYTRVYGIDAITHNIEAILNNEPTDVENLVYSVI